jgi:GTPase SAR1 family protein
MEEIQKYAMDNVALILVGNKCDDEENRKVSTEEGKILADRYKMTFFETSAKSGTL